MTAQITRVYETPYKVSELAFTLNDIEGNKTLENWMKSCRDTIAEEITSQDKASIKMRKMIQELAKAGEQVSHKWVAKRVYAENPNIKEVYSPKWTVNRGYNECTGISEAFSTTWDAVREYKEFVDVSENLKHTVLWRHKEPVSFAESYGKRWNIKRNYSEAIKGKDYIFHTANKLFSENMSSYDVITQKPVSTFFEKLTAKEALKGMLTAMYRENTSLKDETKATVKQGAHAEGIDILSAYQSGVGMSFAAEASIADGYGRKWRVLGRYEENAGIADGIKNKTKICKEDGVGIIDKRLRSVANGVLSNIVISEGETTYAIFEQNADQVAGYAPFVEFKVGDYEYEKALFRMSFSRTNLNNDMKFYDYAVHVDIPDTFDRGESAVNGETKVYFNKFYYHAPEVNVTTVGGTKMLIPRIISLDNEDETGRYFVVILEDLNGESQAGRISWSARGY